LVLVCCCCTHKCASFRYAGTQQPVTSGPPACGSNPPGCATTEKEVVCSINEALITSGGGFASYEPMPSWQKTAVTNCERVRRASPVRVSHGL
jgi:hypothetical protein